MCGRLGIAVTQASMHCSCCPTIAPAFKHVCSRQPLQAAPPSTAKCKCSRAEQFSPHHAPAAPCWPASLSAPHPRSPHAARGARRPTHTPASLQPPLPSVGSWYWLCTAHQPLPDNPQNQVRLLDCQGLLGPASSLPLLLLTHHRHSHSHWMSAATSLAALGCCCQYCCSCCC